MSIADKLRQKLTEKASNAASSSNSLENSEIEFTPPIGTTRVRFLPPLNEDDDFFYRTHSYHFLDGISKDGKGRMIFSKKKYFFDKNNKTVSADSPDIDSYKICPIDDAAKALYDTKTEADKKIASAIKRKRRFYFNVILLDEPDPEKKLRVLVDTSNEGKLARIVCNAMGVPFCRDTEDNWFPAAAESDPDKRYYDLLDPDDGHDFKIVKAKDGNETWDISYEKSFAIEKLRPLTKEEKDLMSKRVELLNHIKYEESYEKVEEYLSTYLSKSVGLNLSDSKPEPKKTNTSIKDLENPTTPQQKAKELKKEKEKVEVEEKDLDDLMDELED